MFHVRVKMMRPRDVIADTCLTTLDTKYVPEVFVQTPILLESSSAGFGNVPGDSFKEMLFQIGKPGMYWIQYEVCT